MKNNEIKTVGDAAAEYANKKYATDKGYPEEDWYISWLSFREGAKWQEEKMYNEIEVRQAQQAILGNIKDALMNKDYIIEYLDQNKIVMGNNFCAEQYYNETFKSE